MIIESVYSDSIATSYSIKSIKANYFSKEWNFRKILANGITNLLADALKKTNLGINSEVKLI